MHKRSFLVVIAALASFFLAAQQVPDSLNMVPNGSFEEIDGKLRRLGGIDIAKGWSSPTLAKADLFSEAVDSESPASAPKNARGFQSALSGTNYAGAVWYSYMDKEPRSYLQVKFKKMLKKGQKYCISYYVSLGDLSKFSSDQVGAYVSRIVVNKKDEASLTYEAQVPALKTTVFEDMNGWQGVCGVYEAKGDEQYLIIGNFAATDKVTAGKAKRQKGETRTQTPIAYFYIDDVSVKAVKYMSECACEQLGKDKSEFIYGRRVTSDPSLTPAQRVDRATVYFKQYNRDIDPSMKAQLDTLVSVLKANTAIRIQLTGHTDLQEEDRVRMRPDLTELAKERAEQVMNYLVNAGIAGSRISVAGRKAEQPASEGDDQVSLSQNRRVEVDVLK
ncbi:MAG: OmpA family protein [Flavobacteriales bacterium]|nr:OmpA family protein [Flavobacteriales bacterium]